MVQVLARNWGWVAARGIVTILFGLLLLYLIAVWALVTGGAEIVAAIRLRSMLASEWLLILAGLLSVAFGILLFRVAPQEAPFIALWTGWFALAIGSVMVAFALHLRGLAPRAVR